MEKYEKQILKMNREILDLSNTLQEKDNFIWMIGQIIKHSGNIQTTEKFMKMICDIQIGVLGLNSCSIYLKNNGYILLYQMSNDSGNKFNIEKLDHFPDFLEPFNKTTIMESYENKNINSNSTLITPIFKHHSDEIVGYIIAEHTAYDFFTNTKQKFYEILSIQAYNSILNYKLYKKVKQLSNKDILTNCYNRRFLDNFTEMYRTVDVLSLIIFDIDKFKIINDTYGHSVGDIILKDISKLAIDFYSQYNGKVIRYGGDEFVIILEKTQQEAFTLTKTFREKLLSYDFSTNENIKPTASFGISSYPEQANSLDELLLFADKSLYDAKEKGRDRIILYASKIK